MLDHFAILMTGTYDHIAILMTGTFNDIEACAEFILISRSLLTKIQQTLHDPLAKEVIDMIELFDEDFAINTYVTALTGCTTVGLVCLLADSRRHQE